MDRQRHTERDSEKWKESSCQKWNRKDCKQMFKPEYVFLWNSVVKWFSVWPVIPRLPVRLESLQMDNQQFNWFPEQETLISVLFNRELNKL